MIASLKQDGVDGVILEGHPQKAFDLEGAYRHVVVGLCGGFACIRGCDAFATEELRCKMCDQSRIASRAPFSLWLSFLVGFEAKAPSVDTRFVVFW